MKPLTLADLHAIDVREMRACGGEWTVEPTCNDGELVVRQYPFTDTDENGDELEPGIVCVLDASENEGNAQRTAEFIAHAREDVPRLVATVRALRTLLCGLAWNESGIDLALSGFGTDFARKPEAKT